MDDIIDVLKRDCQPFIKEFGVQPYNPVYRGTQKEMSDYILKVRSRRKMVPKDTPKHLHDLMDELFFKYHGWKARSEGVFVTHSRSTARSYGWPVIFFPKGKYQYLWNPAVMDAYMSIEEDIIPEVDSLENVSMVRHLTKDDVNDEVFVNLLSRMINGYGNNGYKDIELSHEAMFKCYEYYIVSFENNAFDTKFLQRLKKSL